jgi:hypothetical protein
VYYHGSWTVTRELTPEHTGGPGMARCLTASVNVARRYGPLVSAFALKPCTLARMTLERFYLGVHPKVDEPVDALLITGNKSRYDTPVDMLIVQNPAILTFSRVLRPEEFALLDDGLPVLEEPMGPVDPGWETWVRSMFDGSLAGALENAGWQVDNGTYEFVLKSDGSERDWGVRVYSAAGRVPLEFADLPETAWIVETNFGESGAADSLQKALLIADRWSRERRLEREAQRRPTPSRFGNNLCGAEVPF